MMISEIMPFKTKSRSTTTTTAGPTMNLFTFTKLPVQFIIWHTIIMVIAAAAAAAQNVAMPSTTPTLVHGAIATNSNTNSLNNCSMIKGFFETQGINSAEIPNQPITGKFRPKNFRFFTRFFCFPFRFNWSSISIFS